MSLAKCEREIRMVLKECGNKNEALLPCLHVAQEKCGYLPEEIISFLAKELNLPRVEVYSVATFYSMFNLQRQGKYVIRVCVSLPCYLRGSKEILEALEKELNITAGQTTPDKKFTIEAVSCLGLCDKAPAMMINKEVYGNLTTQKVKQIIRQYKQEERMKDNEEHNANYGYPGGVVSNRVKIILKNVEKKGYKGDIDSYLKEGGYNALKKALKMEPDQILFEMKKSKLVGRGGAAFPTGLKWEFAKKCKEYPKYVVCNADEGEPGTFKDRLILENDPHLVLEAMTICGFTVGAEEGFIYIRGEYFKAYEILKKAIEEAKMYNFLGKNILGSNFSFKINLYRGAGAYVCGEETALLDSLEGKKGQSRIKPPFPTFVGFKNKPTVLNNVETFANIPEIILRDGEWFSKIGSPLSPGTKLYSLSGDINRPGVYELPTSVTLKELIERYGQGVRGELKAILPGGVSSNFLTDKELDVTMDYPSVQKAGSMLGSAAVVVINDTHCMVDLAKRCAEFFDYESCGKCAPCREGTKRAREILTNITQGRGEISDLELLKELQEVMYDTSRCGLGQSALNAVRSSIEKFPDEFEEHISKKKCKLKICPM